MNVEMPKKKQAPKMVLGALLAVASLLALHTREEGVDVKQPNILTGISSPTQFDTYKAEDQRGLAELIKRNARFSRKNIWQENATSQNLERRRASQEIEKAIEKMSEAFLRDKIFMRRVNAAFADSNFISAIQTKSAEYFDLNRFTQKDLFARFVHILPALMSQESRLDRDAVSKNSARGIAQIMPGTYGELVSYIKRRKIHINGITFDYKKDTSNISIASALALLQLDRYIYPTIKRELGDMFLILGVDKTSPKAIDLAFLFSINAYNAGQGTIKAALRHFNRYMSKLKNTNNENFERLRAQSAQDIFFDFSRLAKENRWHKLYGKDASEYVFRILAANKAIDSFVDKERALVMAGKKAGLSAMTAMAGAEDNL